MSKMQNFILDIDYLVNVERMSVAEIATIMGCTESMVEDAICIIRDAFDETLQ
jgi:DNA-directed RNA polymerase specialized sigma24 family protein